MIQDYPCRVYTGNRFFIAVSLIIEAHLHLSGLSLLVLIHQVVDALDGIEELAEGIVVVQGIDDVHGHKNEAHSFG